MIKQEKAEEFFQQFFSLLPEDLRRSRQDLEKNVRAAMNASLSRMNLVTREEFDIQSSLLSRTRELVQELENKITAIEKQIDQKNQH